MRRTVVAVLLAGALATALRPSPLKATPQFARAYQVSCQQCHVLPPKLNAFGEEFLARGYESPALAEHPTLPLAAWVSVRGESRPVAGGERDEIGPFLNRVELISGGKLLRPWLSYFAEWRVGSQETRGDGTLRDRSGRFEDLFVTAALPHGLELTAGQFRQVAQVDVSRRLSLSEPLVLSASLAGGGGGTARERSLRAFSPAGRSPALRLGWRRAAAGGWSWTTSAALPVPGELSLPLTEAAEAEASHEIELEPKGVVLESFARRGVASFGAHVFYDDSERWLGDALAGSRCGDFYWTAMLGVARGGAADRGRWSLEGEYLPGARWGVGARLEDQAGDGAEPALLPYAVWQLGGRDYRLTAVLEQRLQEDRNATLLEIGLVF